ncbi:MAG TPA: biosynthetic arginine decarboxylase [Opitutales bacterium]|nr:biosynthetic arginine decarboxylase [Opitutales bacterium]
MALKIHTSAPWTLRDAEDYYGIKRWGGSHFSIGEDGCLCVHPAGDGRKIRLLDIVNEAASMGLRPPLTIRLQDLLRHRVIQLNEAFRTAIAQEEYSGAYRGVFPIKVNQLREVVEEILDAGEDYGFGIEAGSKPELIIALAALDRRSALLICNGYKDAEYIRLALLGRKLGKNVILVVEQLSEIDDILQIAKETGIEPRIGLRIKLRTTGEGKWATSSGEDAKFGLTTSEVMLAVSKLKKAGLESILQLVHFHIGSQVPNILTIKKAVVEATRFYIELSKLGFNMRFIDVGGGLGIDYDGSRANYESSMNYSLEEYARDVVSNIKSVCDSAGIPVPDIVSESGRALVAPHSVLVLEVFDRISKTTPFHSLNGKNKKRQKHEVITALEHILHDGDQYGRLERFHDAQQKKEEAQTLFTLGFLDLESRAEAENLFWRICTDIRAKSAAARGYLPDELAQLNTMLAEQYVCNFSVFQSLLDHWALDQLFPIMPLHRLDEKPTVETVLADITCDSDGKISRFIDLEDVRGTLALHPLQPNKPYYLGVFLVGAYQDIMGDLHNLFGRVNEVHVFLEDDEEDGFYIEESIQGARVDKILDMIQWDAEELARLMKKQIDRAIKADEVRPREGMRMLEMYEELLREKTYLKPREKAKAKKRK